MSLGSTPEGKGKLREREKRAFLSRVSPPNSFLTLAPPTSNLCSGGGDRRQVCRVGLLRHRRHLVSGYRLSLFWFSVRLNLFAWCLWISPPDLAETKGVLGFSGALARCDDLRISQRPRNSSGWIDCARIW